MCFSVGLESNLCLTLQIFVATESFFLGGGGHQKLQVFTLTHCSCNFFLPCDVTRGPLNCRDEISFWTLEVMSVCTKVLARENQETCFKISTSDSFTNTFGTFRLQYQRERTKIYKLQRTSLVIWSSPVLSCTTVCF